MAAETLARMSNRAPSGSQRQRPTRAQLAIASLLGIAIATFAAVTERIVYDEEVLPGIVVAGIDATGMTERQLTQRLDALAAQLENRVFRATVGATKLTAPASELGYHVDVESTVRAARIAGRTGNPMSAVLGLVTRRISDTSVELRHTIDTASLHRTALRWSTEVNQKVRNASIEIVSGAVRILEPAAASGVAVGEISAALDKASKSLDLRPNITLRQTTVQPTIDRAQAEAVAADARRALAGQYKVRSGSESFVITGTQLASSLEAVVDGTTLRLAIDDERFRVALGPSLQTLAEPPVDARFRVNPDETVSIIASKTGRGPDLRKVAAAILQGIHDIEAPSVTVEPMHDTAWAQSLGITKKIASFTSHHPCCAARVTNIHVAAKLMNGAVIEPGELFSLNDVVGPRTEARGFVPAPVFYGEFTEDFGGGVSQLATTTYNAAFWAGLEIVTHKPHTIYFDRYPMGREATVNYPSLDLKWRNDSRNGVLVSTSYSSTRITVSLYGNTEGRKVRETTDGCSVGPITDTRNAPRCVTVVETIDIIETEVTCPAESSADDPKNTCATLKPGERAAGPSGHTGYSVEYFRTITDPGKPPRVQRFRWRYRMLPDIVLVAPGDPAASTTTTGIGPSTTTKPPGGSTTTKPPATTSTTTTTTP